MNYSDFSYEQLLATLVEQRGYAPRVECGDSKSRWVKSPDFAIITPSTVDEKEGESRYRLSSTLEFVLVKSDVTNSVKAKNELWQQIKCDAVEVVCGLERSPYILSMSDLSIEPVASAKTALDFVAMIVSVTVVSNFDYEVDSSELS